MRREQAGQECDSGYGKDAEGLVAAVLFSRSSERSSPALIPPLVLAQIIDAIT